MEYITDLCWFEKNGVHDSSGRGLYIDYDIMPFSCIHDKNGKEIYEGDIVLTREFYDKPYSKKQKSKRHIGVVEYKVCTVNSNEKNKYKEYGAKWRVKIQDYGKFTYSSWGDFFDCEVIGNIYENPELLE